MDNLGQYLGGKFSDGINWIKEKFNAGQLILDPPEPSMKELLGGQWRGNKQKAEQEKISGSSTTIFDDV